MSGRSVFCSTYNLNSSPAGRVLKSPDHVYGLPELFATFPDASIIHFPWKTEREDERSNETEYRPEDGMPTLIEAR